MTGGEIILTVVLFTLAFLLLWISIRNFNEKGYLFNNAFIFASEEERKTMDKSPYYHQSGVVFAILSGSFVLIGMHLILANSLCLFAADTLIAAAVAYAVISSIAIDRQKKN